VAPLSCGQSSARLVLLLVVLSQPYPWTAAVLVDELKQQAPMC